MQRLTGFIQSGPERPIIVRQAMVATVPGTSI
jgi:hypothetical protein